MMSCFVTYSVFIGGKFVVSLNYAQLLKCTAIEYFLIFTIFSEIV